MTNQQTVTETGACLNEMKKEINEHFFHLTGHDTLRHYTGGVNVNSATAATQYRSALMIPTVNSFDEADKLKHTHLIVGGCRQD